MNQSEEERLRSSAYRSWSWISSSHHENTNRKHKKRCRTLKRGYRRRRRIPRRRNRRCRQIPTRRHWRRSRIQGKCTRSIVGSQRGDTGGAVGSRGRDKGCSRAYSRVDGFGRNLEAYHKRQSFAKECHCAPGVDGYTKVWREQRRKVCCRRSNNSTRR